jgi:hypothetical protein
MAGFVRFCTWIAAATATCASRPERVARFKAALAKTKIKPANVVVHAAYVLSVATPEDEKWSRASAGLTKEHVLIIVSRRFRSQVRNREAAHRQFVDLLRRSLGSSP